VIRTVLILFIAAFRKIIFKRVIDEVTESHLLLFADLIFFFWVNEVVSGQQEFWFNISVLLSLFSSLFNCTLA
jgi:hypothetical protein